MCVSWPRAREHKKRPHSPPAPSAVTLATITLYGRRAPLFIYRGCDVTFLPSDTRQPASQPSPANDSRSPLSAGSCCEGARPGHLWHLSPPAWCVSALPTQKKYVKATDAGFSNKSIVCIGAYNDLRSCSCHPQLLKAELQPCFFNHLSVSFPYLFSEQKIVTLMFIQLEIFQI